MNNGASRGEAAITRRDVAPRVHALRDAVREALFGSYPCDDETADQLRRFDTLLVWCCAMGQEMADEDIEYVTGLLWKAAMKREAA
jgi:hypothetical protein